MPTQLTQEEIDSCRDAFLQYDKDRSGSIDQWELKEVLEGNFFFFLEKHHGRIHLNIFNSYGTDTHG